MAEGERILHVHCQFGDSDRHRDHCGCRGRVHADESGKKVEGCWRSEGQEGCEDLADDEEER